MPNRSKNKGDRFERGIVNEALSMGLQAKRNFMSGAPLDAPFDLTIAGKICECKKRAKPIEFIKKNFKPHLDALIIGWDGGEWVAVVRGKDYLKLL